MYTLGFHCFPEDFVRLVGGPQTLDRIWEHAPPEENCVHFKVKRINLVHFKSKIRRLDL